MTLQSLHVHSNLDDGKSTMEEMVLSAVEKGLDSMGFSGHSYLDFGKEWTMSPENTKYYDKEIDRLRAKYQKEIRIFRGLELDTFSEDPRESFDYLIGSCHNVKKDGNMISVDEDRDKLISSIDRFFGGDGKAFAREYFQELDTLKSRAGIRIVGHFDLLEKFNEAGDLFRREEYLEYALPVMEDLVRAGYIFEINTGAISRGYRTEPYPSEQLLWELKKRGGLITVTADVHAAENMVFGYEEARHLAKQCGFREIMILTDEGFRPERI